MTDETRTGNETLIANYMLLPDDVLYAVLNRAAGERRTTEEVLSELTENDLDQMVAAGKLEVLPLPPSRGSSGESD